MKLTLQTYAHPLAIQTANGPIANRRGFVLTAEDDAGFIGRGEAAPLLGWSDETLAEAGAALASLLAQGELSDSPAFPPTVRHAVTQAQLSLEANRTGRRPAQVLAQRHGLTAQSATRLHRQVATPAAAAAAVAVGFETLKIKVGAASVDADVARVTAIRQQVGPSIALRLDANRAWQDEAARDVLARLAPLDIALLEEPLQDPTPARLAALRRTTQIPLAADESCRSMADLDALIAADAVDAVVIKPMLIGPLDASVAMTHRAAEAGLGVIVTSCFDSTLALDAAHAVAAVCPAHALLACGLDRGTASCGPPPPAPPGQAEALPNPVQRAAQLSPHDVALVDATGELTWSELARDVAHAATALSDRGVRPGDRVAVLTQQDRAAVTALYAVGWLGAEAAPISASLPEETRRTRASNLGARLLIDPATLPPFSGATVAPASWPLRDARLTVMTSGSTDTPKTVSLTTQQLAFGVWGSAMRLGHQHDDRWLLCLPLHHVGGLAVLFRMCWGGGSVHLLPSFDAGEVNALIDDGAVTRVSLVPEMLQRLMDDRGDRPFPDTLRTLLVGGAATPAALARRCSLIRAPLARTWGMTEAGSQVATARPGSLDGPGLIPLVTTEVAPAADGALVVRGPQTGGAQRTDDLGQVAPDGRVTVTGRADDVIISGGDNLGPAEIVNALRSLDGVQDAAVIGVASTRWGHRPVALLVPEPGGDLTDAPTLRALLGDRLARHAIPDQFRWVDTLPRTALGKLDRPAARRLFDPPTDRVDDDPSLQGGPR